MIYNGVNHFNALRGLVEEHKIAYGTEDDNSFFDVKYLISGLSGRIAKGCSDLQFEELRDQYERVLIGCVRTFQGKSAETFRRKLKAIDPHLIQKRRYQKSDSRLLRVIKSIYFTIVRFFTRLNTIREFQDKWHMLTSLEELNKDAKTLIKLFYELPFNKAVIRTYSDLVNGGISPKVMIDLRNQAKKRGIEYLLDSKISSLLASVIDRSERTSNPLLGTAANTGKTGTVAFPRQKGLESSVPFSTGMIDDEPSHMQRWRREGKSDGVQMFPTAHCSHTGDMRKRLIKAAKHNIVISGNYCGGKAFDEVLELIKSRLRELPKLKVVIISHPKFIKDEPKKNIRNLTLIRELEGSYPERFSLVESPNVNMTIENDTCKPSTNHTKYTGIDWGRYYIMGGSGIKDNFALSGVNDPITLLEKPLQDMIQKLEIELVEIKKSSPRISLREWVQKAQECIKQLKGSPRYFPKNYENFLLCLESNIDILKSGGDKGDLRCMSMLSETPELDSGIAGCFVPGNFRDMDFVFSDMAGGRSAGRQNFLEMLRLSYHWDSLNNARDLQSQVSRYSAKQVAQFPIFTGVGRVPEELADSVTQRIMKSSMPEVTSLQTDVVVGFDDVGVGSVEMLYQGPESSKGLSAVADKAIELIEGATNRIVFNHMYFSPTENVMNALREAAKRGVKIEIITAAVTENCPNGQLLFGPNNQWHWTHLVEDLDPESQKNIKIFTYSQGKNGLHKKVVVVDDSVLGGSSNFGYKSLVSSADYESNFVAKSRRFANQTLAIFEEDKARSEEIVDKLSIGHMSYAAARMYSSVKSQVN
jgi:hypothetical protein